MVDKMHNGLIVQSPIRHVPTSLEQFRIVQRGDVVKISHAYKAGASRSMWAIFDGHRQGIDFFETPHIVCHGGRPSVKIYSSEREKQEYSQMYGVILPQNKEIDFIDSSRQEYSEKMRRLELAGLWGVTNG